MKRMRTKAFTLVELLVVITIISVLASLLLPAMEDALRMARLTSCMSQEHQIYIAYTLYGNEFDDYIPLPINSRRAYAYRGCSDQYTGKSTFGNLGVLYRYRYLEDPVVVFCPTYPEDTSALAGLQQLAQNGTTSTGNSLGYVMRGANFRNVNVESGQHFNNSFLWEWKRASWNNWIATPAPTTGHVPSGYCDNRLSQNVGGAAKFANTAGTSTFRLGSARAMLMCRLPDSYYGRRQVHDALTFAVMFADGVVNRGNGLDNPEFLANTDGDVLSWYAKWWGADTQHPSFQRPYSGYASGYVY